MDVVESWPPEKSTRAREFMDLTAENASWRTQRTLEGAHKVSREKVDIARGILNSVPRPVV